MADVNIRRLVESASILSAGGGDSRRHHPLGHRIAKDTRYLHSQGHVYLPQRGEGLERLREAIERPILELPPEFNGSAWRGLLSPSSSFEVRSPSTQELLLEGIAIPESRIGDVRRFALASVLRPAEEAISSQGRLRHDRFAGAAILTVLVDKAFPRSPSDAWVRVEWKTSTAALGSWAARQLEGLAPEVLSRGGRTVDSRAGPPRTQHAVAGERDLPVEVSGRGVRPQGSRARLRKDNAWVGRAVSAP